MPVTWNIVQYMEQKQLVRKAAKSAPVSRPAAPRIAAPAVDCAFRIMEFLAAQPHGAGVSQIARALDISKSSCFNVMSTLLVCEALIKDPRHAVWRLGPKLVKLGTAARRGYSHRNALRHAVQGLVDQFGLTCLVGQVLANHEGIVVIDRVLPRARHADVVTPPIGEVYPLTAPAMGRAVLALLDDDEALLVASGTQDRNKAESRVALLGKLADIRKRGYATSLEEYEPTTHAVACVVPHGGNEPGLVLCLVGHRQKLPSGRMPAIARALIALSRDLPQDLLTSLQ